MLKIVNHENSHVLYLISLKRQNRDCPNLEDPIGSARSFVTEKKLTSFVYHIRILHNITPKSQLMLVKKFGLNDFSFFAFLTSKAFEYFIINSSIYIFMACAQ